MRNARAVWLRAWVFYLQPMVTEGQVRRKRTRTKLLSRSPCLDLSTCPRLRCMRTAEVIKKIRNEARKQGVAFETFERTNHTGIRVGSITTTIGRHRETSNLMAETIYKQVEPALGKGWWR